MSKVKMAHIIAEARGAIAGTVFSRNTFGAYIRTRITPVNPATVDQALVRSQLTTIAQSWRGLTQAERNQWNQAAITFQNTDIFGDSVPLTGFVLHMKLNRNLLAIGQAVITSPPLQTAVHGFTSASLVANTTGGTLDITYAPVIPAATTVIVRATTQLSAGVQFVKSELRQIRTITAANPSPVNVAAAYITKFGALPAIGSKVFVELRGVNDADGLTGTAIKISDIAV